MKNDRRFRDDGTSYLIRYNGRWYAGTCERQHYGWNFDAVYSAGLQMNAGIDAAYEIEGKATRDAPIIEILADAIAEAETSTEATKTDRETAGPTPLSAGCDDAEDWLSPDPDRESAYNERHPEDCIA